MQEERCDVRRKKTASLFSMYVIIILPTDRARGEHEPSEVDHPFSYVSAVADRVHFLPSA